MTKKLANRDFGVKNSSLIFFLAKNYNSFFHKSEQAKQVRKISVFLSRK